MPRRTLEEQLADLKEEEKKLKEQMQEKQKQLQEKKKKIVAKQKSAERKERTRNLIKIGGAVYSVLGDDYREGDVERLIAFLKGQENRGRYFSKAMDRDDVDPCSVPF